MNKGWIFGGLAAAAGLVILVMKGSSLKNMVDKLTITPKLGGKPSLKNGGGNVFSKLASYITGSAYLEVPIDIDFANRSSSEIKISVQSVMAYLKDKNVAESKPGESEVSIKGNTTSTMSGIKMRISTTTLVSVMGSAVESLLNSGNLDSITNELVIKIGATVNNAFRFDIALSMGKSGEVDTGLQTTISGLGLTAATKRSIRPLSEYIAHIPGKENLKYEDHIVKFNGSVSDTVKIMKQISKKYKGDVAELAQWLKRGTVKDTLQSIWDFVYTHIDYVKDSPVVEQVRRPLRTLYDQKADCDCYATLIGAMLESLGIKYKFRIAMYNAGYYQHVYVVVPNGLGEYVVDPVLDSCFTEKPTTKHLDF